MATPPIRYGSIFTAKSFVSERLTRISQRKMVLLPVSMPWKTILLSAKRFSILIPRKSLLPGNLRPLSQSMRTPTRVRAIFHEIMDPVKVMAMILAAGAINRNVRQGRDLLRPQGGPPKIGIMGMSRLVRKGRLSPRSRRILRSRLQRLLKSFLGDETDHYTPQTKRRKTGEPSLCYVTEVYLKGTATLEWSGGFNNVPWEQGLFPDDRVDYSGGSNRKHGPERKNPESF